jgi:hypothetical protein
VHIERLWERGTIMLSQTNLIENIAERCKLEDTRTIRAPMMDGMLPPFDENEGLFNCEY